jgi:hypothetical protein
MKSLSNESKNYLEFINKNIFNNRGLKKWMLKDYM